MPSCCMGKILWVDLTASEMYVEALPETVYRRFLGGIGLAAYILYRDIPPSADPLGPENILAFTSGLLTGTDSLFSGRWTAAAKSPLTGTWGEANCGGTLSPAIKRCGYDGIFFKGSSPRPVYLAMEDGAARLCDAADLWGLNTVETGRRLRAAHPHSSSTCIGPAGERCSLIAGICDDGGRMAARSGLGAVMGSKNLKAVALRGSRPISMHDAEAMRRLTRQAYFWSKLQAPLPPGSVARWVGTLFRVLPFAIAQDGLLYKWLLRRWGTISMNQISVEMGDAPVQNWRGSSHTFPLKQSDFSNPDHITRTETRKYKCRSCALGCGGIVSTRDVPEGHKPEYETTLAWGGLLLNRSLDSIQRINERLNQAGMDSISAGATAAFAIECAERGLISQEQLDGIDLRWGSSDAIEMLVERMIAREGIGGLLADGTHKAAEQLGEAALAYAMQAGGQELAMHDGRNDPGFALHAVVEPMPGRHTNGSQLYYEMFRLWTKLPGLPRPRHLYPKSRKYKSTPALAEAAVACSRFSQVLNGAGLCLFGAFIGVSRIPVFEWLNAASGWQYSPEEYMQAGARIQSLKQMFNVRQGAPLRHDYPDRAAGIPPQAHGANRGRSVDLDCMVRAYWAASGYDEDTGLPTTKTLAGLGLASIIVDEG